MSVPRPAMLVAMVIIFGPPGLHHDLGLARVLLGVEHVVRQLFLVQELRQHLGVLDRGGADQHRLAALVAILDVVDHRLRTFSRLVLNTWSMRSSRIIGHVRRDDHGLQVVDLLELVGFGVGGAGHARELRVHAEIVLERDRGERLVLALDRARLPWLPPPGAGRRTSAGPASGGR